MKTFLFWLGVSRHHCGQKKTIWGSPFSRFGYRVFLVGGGVEAEGQCGNGRVEVARLSSVGHRHHRNHRFVHSCFIVSKHSVLSRPGWHSKSLMKHAICFGCSVWWLSCFGSMDFVVAEKPLRSGGHLVKLSCCWGTLMCRACRSSRSWFDTLNRDCSYTTTSCVRFSTMCSEFRPGVGVPVLVHTLRSVKMFSVSHVIPQEIGEMMGKS